MHTFGSLAAALFGVLVIAGGYLDARYRTIPNALNAVLAILGLASSALVGGGEAALLSLAHLAVSLLIGMGLFAYRAWGGGDAKFYAGTAAWFGLEQFAPLVMAISLSGLVLLLGWFALRRLQTSRLTSARYGQVPYGIAIASGGLLTMAMMVSRNAAAG